MIGLIVLGVPFVLGVLFCLPISAAAISFYREVRWKRVSKGKSFALVLFAVGVFLLVLGFGLFLLTGEAAGGSRGGDITTRDYFAYWFLQVKILAIPIMPVVVVRLALEMQTDEIP